MSANALLVALTAQLEADPGVTATIGPGRIFDQRIPRAEPPYLVLGAMTTNDASTGDGPLSEHRFRIEAWSRLNGRKQALELADAVRAALHEADLPLAGAALINLRHERTTSGRTAKSGLFVARLDFRAVTEP